MQRIERNIRGVLFSDVKGYSGLPEPTLREYSTEIINLLYDRVIRGNDDHLIYKNTWGDATMLISSEPHRIARIALNLRDFYRNQTWQELNINLDLSVRIALHVGMVSKNPNPLNPSDVFGTDLTIAARIEPLTPPNEIYTTEQFEALVDGHDPTLRFDPVGEVYLAKEASKRLLFQLRRSHESPNITIMPYIHVIPLPKDPTYKHISDRLKDCKEGEEVKFIAITGKASMLSGGSLKIGENLLDRAFPNALSRGVRFRGIVLDPYSEEAKFRSSVETPDKPLDRRLLQIDASDVRNELLSLYRREKITEDKLRNLELRYTKIGIAFGLWLFNDVAFMEPIHLAGPGRPHMCGFCELRITKNIPESDEPKFFSEYEILKKHFEVLWANSEEGPWPSSK